MKKIIMIMIGFLSFMSCKAQVAPLYNADMSLPEGTYYKDIDNDLNKFVGTWKWQSSNNSFTIELVKKENVSDDNSFTDDLIGEGKYVANGTETFNTLSLLNDPSIDVLEHTMCAVQIVSNKHYPQCNDCPTNERRVVLSFIDNQRDYLTSTLVLRYVVSTSGVEQLQAKLYLSESYSLPTTTSPEVMRVPYGDYTFVKQ